MFIAMPKIAPSNAVKRIKTTVQRLTPQRLASLKAFSIIQQASNPKNIVLKTLKHQPSKNAESDKPQLIYADNLQNNQLINSLKQLSQPYRPTPWLSNRHLQLVYSELRKNLSKTLHYDHSETLTMTDGGHTALAWFGYHLPADTPTIVIMHTLTGSPKSMQNMVLDLHQQTGWRVVVLVRRGHANLEFNPPRFNIFGNTRDLKEQLAHIERSFPDSTLYAVGSSAGSGLLIRYLGEEQHQAKFKAAFAFCPGYNTDEGFKFCHPFYSKYMAKKLIQTFVTPHALALQALSTYKDFNNAKDLLDFHENVYELSGYATKHAYSLATNPMHVFNDMTCPVMALNAEDDPVCHIQNLSPYVQNIKNMPNVIVVTTKKGSHCAYPQGWQAKSWAHQLMGNYFLAMHHDTAST